MTSDALVLRDASQEDAEAVLSLWHAAYMNSGRSHFDDIATLLAHGPSARLIVAEHGGRVVGSLIATFDGWRGNIYRLAVHPEEQRRGIARRLVDEAHAWLQQQGCRRITALVEGDHNYSTSFWESAGYRHDAGMRRYSKDFE